MPTMQIKNLPPDVHRTFQRRAVEAGQSLQEYMLARLTEEARTPTLEELFERVEKRSGLNISLDEAVQYIREDRERE
jgi:plasmid stability protein